jgi:hypothetical protein
MTELNQNIAPRSLDQLQRWMQSVITHPAGIEAGVMSDRSRGVIDVETKRLDEVVLPSQRLSSADRLRVYGNAYFARLLECLRAEFPAMVHALGEEAFDGLALGYLLEHPSRSDTLTQLASRLPEYLEQTRPPRESLEVAADSNPEAAPDFADFLIDLSRLERTYGEVFDGAGPENEVRPELNVGWDQLASSAGPPSVSVVSSWWAGAAKRHWSHPRAMTSTTMPKLDSEVAGHADGLLEEGLTAEQFAQSRIVLHECVRLVSLKFPVHEYITAVRHNAEATFPDARPTLLVVTRRDFIVRRFEVTPVQFALLAALQRGDTVGNGLLATHAAQANDHADLTQLATDLRQWFFDWAAAPLFLRIDGPNT